MVDTTCPVCLDETPDGPIYQCHRGHLVCGTCYDELHRRQCPTCRTALPSRKRIRCLIAERSVASTPASCAGCNSFRGTREDLRSHTCVVRDAPDKVTMWKHGKRYLSEYPDHISYFDASGSIMCQEWYATEADRDDRLHRHYFKCCKETNVPSLLGYSVKRVSEMLAAGDTKILQRRHDIPPKLWSYIQITTRWMCTTKVGGPRPFTGCTPPEWEVAGTPPRPRESGAASSE